MISVIVPVYNVELYIRQCIDSIIAQTYHDWELLLIDDGSLDNSGIICDDFAKKDSRIKVFHISNGGVSNARNMGIKHAKGKYTTFVDPDDWVAPNWLSMCRHIMLEKNPDMLQYAFQEVFEDGTTKISGDIQAECVNGVEYVRGRMYNTSVWSTIFKTSVIKDNECFFDVKLWHGEDYHFIISMLRYCNRIVHITAPLYFYRILGTGAGRRHVDTKNLLRSCYLIIRLAIQWPPARPVACRQLKRDIKSITKNILCGNIVAKYGY